MSIKSARKINFFLFSFLSKIKNITKISNNISYSEHSSVKRSGWIAPSYFLLWLFNIPPLFCLSSPPLYLSNPTLSHFFYSSNLRHSLQAPTSVTSLLFACPSLFHPRHTPHLSLRLPSLQLCPCLFIFFTYSSDNHYTKLMQYQSLGVPLGILLSTSDKCRGGLLSFEDRWALSVN